MIGTESNSHSMFFLLNEVKEEATCEIDALESAEDTLMQLDCADGTLDTNKTVIRTSTIDPSDLPQRSIISSSRAYTSAQAESDLERIRSENRAFDLSLKQSHLEQASPIFQIPWSSIDHFEPTTFRVGGFEKKFNNVAAFHGRYLPFVHDTGEKIIRYPAELTFSREDRILSSSQFCPRTTARFISMMKPKRSMMYKLPVPRSGQVTQVHISSKWHSDFLDSTRR